MNRYHTFQEWTAIINTLKHQVEKPGMVLPDEFKEALASLNGACARNINAKEPEPKQHA